MYEAAGTSGHYKK
ncbi:hormone receptor 39, partial [Danaus plexippus plexippus]